MESIHRFSGRVNDYSLYRPSYPAALIDVLAAEASFAPGKAVADVGAGTGKLSSLFADRGSIVYCIEPNSEMLHACRKELLGKRNCNFIQATAERTGLAPGSVDIVSAGQSFHWFDAEAAGIEFFRILRPDGCVFIVWNTRLGNANPFMKRYCELIEKYSVSAASSMSSHREGIDKLFGRKHFVSGTMPNSQVLDFRGLTGRLSSASYTPAYGSPEYVSMLSDARSLFDRFESGGRVELLYQTEYYIGRPESK
jgi:SAM-dependent methyltransferase